MARNQWKFSDSYSIDYEKYNDKTASELRTLLRSLTKSQNERLRELERQGLSIASNAYRWMEKQALKEPTFFGTTKKGEIKFTTSFKNMNIYELRHYANMLERFKIAKTSSVRGVKEKHKATYEKWLEGATEEQKKALPFEKFAEVFENNLWENLVKMFDSEQAQQIIKCGMDIEDIKAILRKNKYIDDNNALVPMDEVEIDKVKEWFKLE